MSKQIKPAPLPGEPHSPITPMIGALLRLPHEEIIVRMLARVNAGGLDISATELSVFLFPGPDGRRPIDLARQCNMTRQALNYVLAGLVQRGYLERRPAPGRLAPLIYMSDRGWQVMALCRECVAGVEQEWSRLLGAQRFNALRQALQDIAIRIGKLPA